MKYDLSISFAEEDAGIARTLHDALKKIDKSVKVYFYKKTQNLTHDLEIESKQVYQYETKHAAILLSEQYFKKHKEWTKQEFDAILQKARMLRGAYGNQYKFLILISVSGFKMDKLDRYLIDWGYSKNERSVIIRFVKKTVWHKWEGHNDELAQKIYRILAKRRKIPVGILVIGFSLLLISVLAWQFKLNRSKFPEMTLPDIKPQIDTISMNDEEKPIGSRIMPSINDLSNNSDSLSDITIELPSPGLPIDTTREVSKPNIPTYTLFIKYTPGIDSIFLNSQKSYLNPRFKNDGLLKVDSGENTIVIYHAGIAAVRWDGNVKDDSCALECTADGECTFLCDSFFENQKK